MRNILVILITFVAVSCSNYIAKRDIPSSLVVLIRVEQFENKIYNTYVGVGKWENYQVPINATFDINDFFKTRVKASFEKLGYQVVFLPQDEAEMASQMYTVSHWDGSKKISQEGRNTIDLLKQKYKAEVFVNIGTSREILNKGAFGPDAVQCGIYTNVNFSNSSHIYCERWAVSVDLSNYTFLMDAWTKAPTFHAKMPEKFPEKPSAKLISLAERQIQEEQVAFINAISAYTMTRDTPEKYDSFFIR
tara:strand:- start:2193 stop:2936 length:744 start_codon:yes stop_codon:yes gene_type:complete